MDLSANIRKPSSQYCVPKLDFPRSGKTLIQRNVFIADRYDAHLLGKGGFGEVWQAYDVILDEWVAIKVAKPRNADDEGIQHELRTLRSLPRDRFMNAYEYFFDAAKGLFGYTMEPLYSSDWMRLDIFLSKGFAKNAEGSVSSFIMFLAIFLDLARSIQALHEQPRAESNSDNRVIHGDIKPSNLFVHLKGADEALRNQNTSFALVKIADFGLSCSEGDLLKGYTLNFTSPQDAVGGIATTAVDIYSLGQTYLHCLHGEAIPPGKGIHNRIRSVIKQAAPFADLGGDLADLVIEMLAINPLKRPPIESVIADLSNFGGLNDREWQILRALESSNKGTASLDDLTSILMQKYYGPTLGRERSSGQLRQEIRAQIARLSRAKYVKSAGQLRYSINRAI